MRIAVTGAGGFVGKELCCALEARGHSVVPVSLRFQTSTIDREMIRERLDVFEGCDVVVNAAAAKTECSNADILINRELPKIIADLPRVRQGDILFLHLSSMNVGISSLKDPYTISKRIAETSLQNCQVTIVRPGLIWSFIGGDAARAIKVFRKPLPFVPIPRPGNTYRPIMIEDFVEWLCEAIESGLKAEVVSVIGDREMTMFDLLVDLARTHAARVLPLHVNWLQFLLRPLDKYFFSHSLWQQMLTIDKGVVGEDCHRVVMLPFPKFVAKMPVEKSDS
jgi:nucleoside-diphosphate-sugar epimerase